MKFWVSTVLTAAIERFFYCSFFFLVPLSGTRKKNEHSSRLFLGDTSAFDSFDAHGAATLFPQVVASQADIVVHTPEFAARCGLALFDRSSYIQSGFAREPGAATANSTQRMGIAIADFRPAIDFAVT